MNGTIPRNLVDKIEFDMELVSDEWKKMKEFYNNAKEIDQVFIDKMFNLLNRQNSLLIRYEIFRKNLTTELNYKRLILENKYNIHKEINFRMNNKLLDKIYNQENCLIEKNKEIERMKELIKKTGINNSIITHNISDFQTFSVQEGNLNLEEVNINNKGNFDSISQIQSILNPSLHETAKNGLDISLANLENGIDNLENLNVKTFQSGPNKNKNREINSTHNKINIFKNNNTVIVSPTTNEKTLNLISQSSPKEFNGTIQILNRTFSKIVEDYIDEKLEIGKAMKEIEKEKSISNFIRDKKKKENEKFVTIETYTKNKKPIGGRSMSTGVYSNGKVEKSSRNLNASKSPHFADNTYNITMNNQVNQNNKNKNNKSNEIIRKSDHSNNKINKRNIKLSNSILNTSSQLNKSDILVTINTPKTKDSSIQQSRTKYTQKLISKYHKVIENYNEFLKTEEKTSKSPRKKGIKNSDSGKSIKNLDKFINNNNNNATSSQPNIKNIPDEIKKNKPLCVPKINSKKSIKK